MIAHQSSLQLADGRELLYFDEAARTHPEVDRRPLELRSENDAGEVRYDALTGDWVAIAAHRNSRPYLPPSDQCPLCPSSATALSEIPAHKFDVAVFENRFPSLGPALGLLPPPLSDGEWPPGTSAPGYGRCEVVVFSDQHQGSFGTLGVQRATTVLQVLAERTKALSALAGIAQVFPFENRGKDIGVTLEHPHGQIYAYPYVPPRSLVMAQRALAYAERTNGRHLLDDVVAREREEGSRMLIEGTYFSAFVPFAAHWPIEVHVVPHEHVADLTALSAPQIEELAAIYLDILGRIDALYGQPTGYIGAWHQAPLDAQWHGVSGLHLQITSPRRAADKLKYLAGSEAAMGAFINDKTPEAIAASLREARLNEAQA